jgi:hypothetical protein
LRTKATEFLVVVVLVVVFVVVVAIRTTTTVTTATTTIAVLWQTLQLRNAEEGHSGDSHAS